MDCDLYLSKSKNEFELKVKDLKTYIKVGLANKAKKLKGKYPPISEIVDGKPRILKIQNLYELKDDFRHYYLIMVLNYEKKPKNRFYLAIRLASQSSDFLVSIAKELIKGIKGLKLIQFAIHPKNFRVNLLALKEILSANDFLNSVKVLGDLRINFRTKLDKVRNIIQKI